MSKTTVFLTGATGTMGWAGLQELLAHKENYNIRVLARHSEKNIKKLAPLMDDIEVIWGDLTKYEDVKKGIDGSDIVLHVGGMVSPQADYRPKATRRTNITAAEHIVKAVLAQENQPKVVYIGSVAQMGDRREPLHWGRTGDPICVSAYDHYGITKAQAERIITDSGIKCWASLRQSGILYPAILKNYDPIMFHVPIRGVLEWATVEDSGRLLEGVCRPSVPAEFWNRYYNIGSGDQYRISNYKFECLLLDAIGCPRPEQIFESKWFTTRNFHGMWYYDGDDLENFIHFRANVPVEEYFRQMANAETLPAGIKFAAKTHIAKLFPHCVKLAMRAMAYSEEHGTQWWIRHNKEQRINAYYGSLEKYKAIRPWKEMDLSEPSREKVVVLDHGYDEHKPMEEFTIEDMQQAAAFRGGKCLSETMTTGDWDTKLLWEAANGEQFEASPRLILLGGHWAPSDMPWPYEGDENARPWHWDEVAKHNPFFAQLWAPLHDADEDNVYDYHVFDGWEARKK
uniref:Putative epimerase n=1 Tax=uncultured bacterium fosmid pJB102C1 TaxID=1478050 RepID=A0A0H3U888_9BACT|nr:putative epimerase [uncultured bacterium fosmid pJB102C1]